MIPVVLFFQSTTSKSWRDKLSGVYRFAQKAGWQVQVVNTRGKRMEISESLKLWHPIGCIVDRAMTLAKDPVNVFRNVPTVLLDQNPKTATGVHSSITHDSAASARLATKELLKTSAIAFSYIPWHTPVFWSNQREVAFAESIQAAGKRYVKWTNDFASLPKPCGILCANDITAQAAMHLAVKEGWKIPDELLFVGIDNDELICNNLNPALTSILPDFEQCGILAGEMACQKAAKPTVRLRPQTYGVLDIIRRGSTRLLTRRDSLVEKALDFIRSKATTGIGAKDVVALFPCSRRMAEIRFERITGRTILDEITEMRLQTAKSLLTQGSISPDAVACLSGWKTYNTFRNQFKKLTGLSPDKWRRQNASRP